MRKEKKEMLFAEIEKNAKAKRASDASATARLRFASAADKIDARLVVLSSAPKVNQANGMDGALALFADWLSPEWYKRKSAQKLLAVRQTRRWYLLHRGQEVKLTGMLADISHLRKVASGLAPMPQVMIGGL